MQGKYRNPLKYGLVKVQRAAMRSVLHHMAHWEPMTLAEPGYTVILACSSPLAPILKTNLLMLARQDLRDMHEVLVIFDRPRRKIDYPIEEAVCAEFPDVPLRFIYYTPWQTRLAATIGWAWVYSWLSWSLGIAATRTRYALLHDFDAMLIRRDLLAERYRVMTQRGDQYLGTGYYRGNGVEPGDGLVTTFELMFDASFVRRAFRPIDLFNHVSRRNGRTIDYDTFLWAQSRAGQASVLLIDETDMVHPSQLICQFTELTQRNRLLSRTAHSLLLIPYLLYLADAPDQFEATQQQLDRGPADKLRFYGKNLEMSRLAPEHARWMKKQAARLEAVVAGEMRAEVERYFSAIERWTASNDDARPQGGSCVRVGRTSSAVGAMRRHTA